VKNNLTSPQKVVPSKRPGGSQGVKEGHGGPPAALLYQGRTNGRGSHERGPVRRGGTSGKTNFVKPTSLGNLFPPFRCKDKKLLVKRKEKMGTVTEPEKSPTGTPFEGGLQGSRKSPGGWGSSGGVQ